MVRALKGQNWPKTDATGTTEGDENLDNTSKTENMVMLYTIPKLSKN